MSLFELITPNKKIPKHEDYNKNVRKSEFWEEAIEVSDEYWDVPDACNNDALKRFTCESLEDYHWRQKISSPKNFMGSILNKYLSTAFKEKALRSDLEFFKNVDLLGSSMSEFMEMAAKYALIDGVSYIMPDSTAQDSNLSEAQKSALGIRAFLRFIECSNVVNWIDYLGHLQEAIVRFEDPSGQEYYMYYDTQYYARIDVDKKDIVHSVGATIIRSVPQLNGIVFPSGSVGRSIPAPKYLVKVAL